MKSIVQYTIPSSNQQPYVMAPTHSKPILPNLATFTITKSTYPIQNCSISINHQVVNLVANLGRESMPSDQVFKNQVVATILELAICTQHQPMIGICNTRTLFGQSLYWVPILMQPNTRMCNKGDTVPQRKGYISSNIRTTNGWLHCHPMGPLQYNERGAPDLCMKCKQSAIQS